jgi:SET domain-containing protein
MILVKTKLAPSSVDGIGLFASEFIAKGTTTWKYDCHFDTAFNEKVLSYMSEPAREQFIKYAFYHEGKYILCFDDQRFINHSSTDYNIRSYPEHDIALRDIFPGEELLCNYRHFEEDWFSRRGISEDFIISR